MRTVDVARRAGCSIQQVRKLEAAGVLPPRPAHHLRLPPVPRAPRRQPARLSAAGGGHRPGSRHAFSCAMHTATKARCWHDSTRPTHGCTRNAANSSSPGRHCGPSATSRWPTSTGRLDVGRGTRPCPRRTTFRSAALGRRKTAQSTSKRNGSRSYSPVDVRDARLIHQLRQAGHRIAPLRDLLPTLRREHDWDELLADRDHSIQTRARALLGGTAALAALLGDSRGTSQS